MASDSPFDDNGVGVDFRSVRARARRERREICI